MQKLLVYSRESSALIGTGWLISTTKRIYAPTLVGLDGTTLPEGWYNLSIQDEKFLVVLNRSIH